MDSDRAIRLTVAGWALLIAWFGQRWLLGLAQGPPLSDPTQNWAGALAAAFLASPLLGLFVASLAHLWLRMARGCEAQFEIPAARSTQRQALLRYFALTFPNEESLKPSLRELPEFAKQEGTEDALENNGENSAEKPAEKWWQRPWSLFAYWWCRRQNDDRLTLFVNVAFHTNAPQTLISFVARRWTLYWMYVNVTTALVVGSFMPAVQSAIWHWRSPQLPDGLKLFAEIALLTFVAYSVHRAKRLRHETSEITRLWITALATKQPAGK